MGEVLETGEFGLVGAGSVEGLAVRAARSDVVAPGVKKKHDMHDPFQRLLLGGGLCSVSSWSVAFLQSLRDFLTSFGALELGQRWSRERGGKRRRWLFSRIGDALAATTLTSCDMLCVMLLTSSLVRAAVHWRVRENMPHACGEIFGDAEAHSRPALQYLASFSHVSPGTESGR